MSSTEDSELGGRPGLRRAVLDDLGRLAGAAVRTPVSVNRALVRLPDTLERLVEELAALTAELSRTRETVAGAAQRVEDAVRPLERLAERPPAAAPAATETADMVAELRRVNEEFAELVRLLPPVSSALRAMGSWQERFGLGRWPLGPQQE